MAISYDPLWRTLLSMGINKTEMRKRTGIATATLAKLTKNESLTLAMIDKICLGLGCTIQEVVEIVPSSKEELYANLKIGTIVYSKLPGITYNSYVITNVAQVPGITQYSVHPILTAKKNSVSSVEIEAVIDDKQVTAYILDGPNTEFAVLSNQILKIRGFVNADSGLNFLTLGEESNYLFH